MKLPEINWNTPVEGRGRYQSSAPEYTARAGKVLAAGYEAAGAIKGASIAKIGEMTSRGILAAGTTRADALRDVGRIEASGIMDSGRMLASAMEKAGNIYADAIYNAGSNAAEAQYRAANKRINSEYENRMKASNLRYNLKDQKRRENFKLANNLVSLLANVVPAAINQYAAEQGALREKAEADYEHASSRAAKQITESHTINLNDYEGYELGPDLEQHVTTTIDDETGETIRAIDTDRVSESILEHINDQIKKEVSGKITGNIDKEKFDETVHRINARQKIEMVGWNAKMSSARLQGIERDAIETHIENGNLSKALEVIEMSPNFNSVQKAQMTKMAIDTDEIRTHFKIIQGLGLLPSGEVPAEAIEAMRQTLIKSGLPVEASTKLIGHLNVREKNLKSIAKNEKAQEQNNLAQNAVDVGTEALNMGKSAQDSVNIAYAEAKKLGLPASTKQFIRNQVLANYRMIETDKAAVQTESNKSWVAHYNSVISGEGEVVEMQPPPGTATIEMRKAYSSYLKGLPEEGSPEEYARVRGIFLNDPKKYGKEFSSIDFDKDERFVNFSSVEKASLKALQASYLKKKASAFGSVATKILTWDKQFKSEIESNFGKEKDWTPEQRGAITNLNIEIGEAVDKFIEDTGGEPTVKEYLELTAPYISKAYPFFTGGGAFSGGKLENMTLPQAANVDKADLAQRWQEWEAGVLNVGLAPTPENVFKYYYLKKKFKTDEMVRKYMFQEIIPSFDTSASTLPGSG